MFMLNIYLMILYVGFKRFEMEGIIFKEIYETLQDMKFLSDIKKNV